MKLLTKITLSALAVFTLSSISGCSSVRNMIIEDSIKGTKGSEDSQKVAKFEKRFEQVLDDLDKKDDYKKVPLDGTDDTEWLVRQSFKLWDKQISKDEYVNAGEKKFPVYSKSFGYLADEFQK